MLVRPARKDDTTALLALLEPWLRNDPSWKFQLESISLTGEREEPFLIDVLEVERKVACAAIWRPVNNARIELLALNFALEASNDLLQEFMQREIVEWSKRKTKQVTIKIPRSVAEELVPCLKKMGFAVESLTDTELPFEPIIAMTKTFVHETIKGECLLNFLKKRFTNLGYEIVADDNGFSFRMRDLYQKPFVVGSWHKVTPSGNGIIVYPPAKKIEDHELEIFYYPLKIVGPDDTPILVTLEKKKACSILKLPKDDADQKNMFEDDSDLITCGNDLNHTTYSIATGHKNLRKGLPILFYVNGLGAAGEARIVDWETKTVSNLEKQLDDFPGIGLEDLDIKTARSACKPSLILKIKFNCYKSFHRVISFEEIKKIDASFNPQRRRFVSNSLFDSIIEMAYQS